MRSWLACLGVFMLFVAAGCSDPSEEARTGGLSLDEPLFFAGLKGNDGGLVAPIGSCDLAAASVLGGGVGVYQVREVSDRIDIYACQGDQPNPIAESHRRVTLEAVDAIVGPSEDGTSAFLQLAHYSPGPSVAPGDDILLSWFAWEGHKIIRGYVLVFNDVNGFDAVTDVAPVELPQDYGDVVEELKRSYQDFDEQCSDVADVYGQEYVTGTYSILREGFPCDPEEDEEVTPTEDLVETDEDH